MFCNLGEQTGNSCFFYTVCTPTTHSHPTSCTFGGYWADAVGRGSQVQGLWVLHISQPGRLGALMKVQEGQDQPGWGGGKWLLLPHF